MLLLFDVFAVVFVLIVFCVMCLCGCVSVGSHGFGFNVPVACWLLSLCVRFSFLVCVLFF